MLCRGEAIGCETFLSDVHHFAACLPDKQYAINLVSDHYLFLVAFCAALVRGACNVLPPNAQPAVQAEIARGLGDAYVVHDTGKLDPGLASIRVSRSRDAARAVMTLEHIGSG